MKDKNITVPDTMVLQLFTAVGGLVGSLVAEKYRYSSETRGVIIGSLIGFGIGIIINNT